MFARDSSADHSERMIRPRAQNDHSVPEPQALMPTGPRVGGRALPGHQPRSHARVLIVEDDENARALLSRVLKRHGLGVIESIDAASALRQLFSARPDLVLLDLQLPDLSGAALLQRIRELTDVPVMVVTAERDESTCVTSLRAGADDFMSKPFGVQELLARVEALLRRAPSDDKDEPARYSDGLLEIDFASLEVRAQGEVVPLTPLQLRLLTALVHHRGHVLSAEQLLRLAWDDDMVPRERVKLYVGYLRRRFRDRGVDLPIETVRGFGYRYRPPAS
jgi:DNA-binding response OmpR family regulator